MTTNSELVQLMNNLPLSAAEVAKTLNVPLQTVYRWTTTDMNKPNDLMPESELRLLKYSLMTENKNKHLF